MARKTVLNAEKQLRLENRELRLRLIKAEEALTDLQKGETDAASVKGSVGEEAYPQSSAETLYRSMIEQMNSGVVTLASDGTIKYCNRQFAELISYPPEQTTGADIRQFVAEDNLGKFNALFKKGLELRCSGEVCFIGQESRVQYFHLSLSPLPQDLSVNVCVIVTDITELNRADKTLIEDEERFRMICVYAPVLIVAFDNDGRCTFWNKECEKTFGWTIEEINKQDTLRSLFYPDVRKREQVLMNVTSKHEEIFMEWNPPTKNRSVLTCMWASFTLPNGTLLNLGYDISERKHAELVSKENELKYRELIQNSPDAIVIYIEGKIVMVNKAGLHLMKASSAEELIGKPVLQFVHPDYKAFVANRMKRISSEKAVLPLVEEKFVRIDGSEVDVEVKAMPLRFDNKLAVQLIVRDITQRKQAEEAMRESEKRMKEAQRIALVGNWELDLKMNKLTWSDEIYPIFELNPAKFSATYEAFMKAIHPDDRNLVNKAFKSSIETHTPVEIDHRLLLPDGRVKYVHECYETFYDSMGNPLRSIGIVQDITWRKHTELLLNKKNAELIRLNADKDRFISILAHDLKSPFNAILGFMDLLTSEIRRYDIDTIEHQLNIVNSAAKHFYDLLDDLLMWARSQSGKLAFEPKKVSFMDVCQDILSNTKLIADSKNITIKNFAPVEMNVFADVEMLKTILRNLISNAIKFTNPGGRIEITAVRKPTAILVSVSDNGVGMSAEIIKKLFNITQFHSTKGTLNESGSGLGLFLVKEFVEKHGGKLWVESTLQNLPEGKPGGSAFYFLLPDKVGPKVKPFSGNEPVLDVEMKRNKLKILVVDDDESSELLLTTIFKKIGNEVFTAKNGSEAVETFHNNPDLDLIMMDLFLPEMDGYEATRKIRQINKDVVIIAQTAFVMTETREKAIEAGFNDYISKPVRKDYLMTVVGKYFLFNPNPISGW